jgi:hypothetical protein
MAQYMVMNIVRTRRYLRDLERMGVSADEQATLERSIVDNPQAGSVIPGLDGLRKIRFGIRGKGKRGGGRAIYYLMLTDETALMITAYAKNEREDLSSEQKKVILSLLKELKNG